jgi:hypothetical protein
VSDDKLNNLASGVDEKMRLMTITWLRGIRHHKIQVILQLVRLTDLFRASVMQICLFDYKAGGTRGWSSVEILQRVGVRKKEVC